MRIASKLDYRVPDVRRFELESVFASRYGWEKAAYFTSFPTIYLCHSFDRLELTMESARKYQITMRNGRLTLLLINDVELGRDAPGTLVKMGQLTPSWWLDRFTNTGFSTVVGDPRGSSLMVENPCCLGA